SGPRPAWGAGSPTGGGRGDRAASPADVSGGPASPEGGPLVPAPARRRSGRELDQPGLAKQAGPVGGKDVTGRDGPVQARLVPGQVTGSGPVELGQAGGGERSRRPEEGTYDAGPCRGNAAQCRYRD